MPAQVGKNVKETSHAGTGNINAPISGHGEQREAREPCCLHRETRVSSAMRPSVIVPEEQEFLAFVAEHFDAAYYREMYSDVAQAGVVPLEHWLNDGIGERRQIAKSVVLRYGKDARRSSDRNWRHYQWRGLDVAARLLNPVPPEVLNQIARQGRHDPAVLAIGADAVAKLASDDRENVHLDVAALRRAIPDSVECVLILPNQALGKGLTGDLIAGLNDAGLRSIQIIVADQESPAGDVQSAIATPFGTNGVLFWQDLWIGSPQPLRWIQLAQLIRLLQPRITIVAGSRRGYETVARFGRPLSETTQIYCMHADADDDGDLAAYVAQGRLGFATCLTADYTFAAERNVVALPHRLVAVADEIFAQRLSARRQRAASRTRPLNWAWAGRLAQSKATRILSELSKCRPDDRFDLFGPVDGSLDALGLAQPNVRYGGIPGDFALADFSGHDGFLFTGTSQGSAVIALQASQHAIPLVLSQEAGLSGTFDRHAVFFVEPGEDDDVTRRFCLALDQVRELSGNEIGLIMAAARDQAVKRHSRAAFVAAVAALFART